MTTRPEIVWDDEEQHYVVRIDGPGNPVVWSTSLDVLQDFIDYLMQRQESGDDSSSLPKGATCGRRSNRPR